MRSVPETHVPNGCCPGSTGVITVPPDPEKKTERKMMQNRMRAARRAGLLLSLTMLLAVTVVPARGVKIEQAIDESNRAMSAAFAQQDVIAIVARYTSDAVLMPPGTEAVSGAAAIEAHMQATMDAGVHGLELKTTSIEMHGKMAVEIGRWAAFNADGKSLGTGDYMVVWEQEKGTWKMSRDIWNNDAKTED